MASILLTVEFEIKDDASAKLAEIIDGMQDLVEEAGAEQTPMFGLEVDGVHMDPDEPESRLDS